MPTLEHISVGRQARRELIQVFTALGLHNEIVFFVTVKEYKRRPSKDRAKLIHKTFLENHALGVQEQIKLGEGTVVSSVHIPLATYNQAFRTRYQNRVLGTSIFYPKPPASLFDPFVNAFKNSPMVQYILEQYSYSFIKLRQDEIDSFRTMTGGRTRDVDGEANTYKKMVDWSNKLSLVLVAAFDPDLLGLLNAFTTHLPKAREMDYIRIYTGMAGTKTYNLFLYPNVFPDLKGEVRKFLNFSQQQRDDARTEPAINATSAGNPSLKVTAAVIEDVLARPDFAVFADLGYSESTSIPTLTAPYKRTSIGICKTFFGDWPRTPPKVGGRVMENSWEGFKRLFDFVGWDEAMLFVVSQLASQAGVSAMIPLLFIHKTFENRGNAVFDWRMTHDKDYLNPVAWPEIEINITSDMSYQAEVEAVLKARAFYTTNDKTKMGTPMALEPKMKDDLGIDEFKAAFQVTLKRSDGAITMELTKAELKIKFE